MKGWWRGDMACGERVCGAGIGNPGTVGGGGSEMGPGWLPCECGCEVVLRP